MARMARLVVPGLPHHVVQRGIRRSKVFLDDQDRFIYERLLKEKREHYGLDVISYCWMTTHTHLIAIPEAEDSLGKAIRDTHGSYATYFNRKYGFSGHLWQARFHSCVLDEEHFWTAIRYVEHNPVRAGMVEKAEHYPWSSAAAHCGLGQDPLLAPLKIDRRLIPDWSAWLSKEQSISEVKTLRLKTRTGRPLVSEAFLERLQEQLGLDLKPRKRGRRRKEDGIK